MKKKDIKEIRGYDLTKKEMEAFDEAERITYAITDKVLSFNIGYSTSKFFYELKNSKRLEDRVSTLEHAFKEMRLNVNDNNLLELYNLITNFLYSPQEMDKYILDNFIDILNSNEFNESEVHEFLNYSIYDINKLKRLSEVIFYDQKNDTYLMAPGMLGDDLAGHMAQLRMIELRNYAFMSGAGGVTVGGNHQNGYNRLQLTAEGVRFFALFFRRELLEHKQDINDLSLFFTLNSDGRRLCQDAMWLKLPYSSKVRQVKFMLHAQISNELKRKLSDNLEKILSDV